MNYLNYAGSSSQFITWNPNNVKEVYARHFKYNGKAKNVMLAKTEKPINKGFTLNINPKIL